MDDYMAKVLTLQDEQLAMIAVLREQLLHYRLSQANVRLKHSAGNDLVAVDVDGSFEDLRD
jgi:hypothetical protein